MSKARQLIHLVESSQAPKEIKSIWDDGGATQFRYTIVLKDEFENYAYSFGKEGVAVRGWMEKKEYKRMDFGKKISWADLSKKSQAHIVKQINFIMSEGFDAFVKGLEVTEGKVNLRNVVKQYLETALWAETDDDGEPLDDNYGVNDIDRKSVKKAEKDVKDFLKKAEKLLTGLSDTDIGHDFWLTRNGHGAGFWDRNLGDQGEKLSKIASSFGSAYIYVGDDGKVYID